MEKLSILFKSYKNVNEKTEYSPSLADNLKSHFSVLGIRLTAPPWLSFLQHSSKTT